MPSITYSKFDIGLDRRKGASVSEANRLQELQNAFVNSGRVIEKRPGLIKLGTLETGTFGLISGGGYLNTFFSGTAIVHSDTTFLANRIEHPTVTSGVTITDVLMGDVFSGYLYVSVKFSDGTTWHFYLDADAAWVASTAYSVGDFVEPITLNGYRYEVTAIAGTGTSDAAEPTWPTVVGDTVVDNPGANQITWTCRSKSIADENCPHSDVFSKQESRMFAPDGDVVRYCALNEPRDWTTSSDAGFMATGLKAKGSENAIGIGTYGGKMAVFMQDGMQLWSLDTAVANIVFDNQVEGAGTLWSRSIREFSGDILYLAKAGVRSITTQYAIQDNLQEVDVGSPIDSIIKAGITDADNPMAAYFNGAGQYWLVNPGNGITTVYPYSFSRTEKIAAWSEYLYGKEFTDVTVHDGHLCLRSGDDVYKVDESGAIYSDDGESYEMLVKFPYLDFKLPGITKYISSFDCVVEGEVEVYFNYLLKDENGDQQEYQSTSLILKGDTRVEQSIPMEMTLTSIAPVFKSTSTEKVRIDSITFHYEPLGVV